MIDVKKDKTKGMRAVREMNKARVKKYWIKNTDATGVEISKALNLSLVTVYNHLKKIR
ncbi:MAG: hypothetical protein WC077_03395 [Bacteroidales bacterium]